MKKRIFIFSQTILCLFLCCLCASAAPVSKEISAVFSNISLYIDGNKTELFDANQNYIEPFIYNNTTYLPLRAVSEALHMEVNWDQETYSVYLRNTDAVSKSVSGDIVHMEPGKKTLAVTYNNIQVYVNSVQLELINSNGDTVEPFIYNGSTYLPIRNVAEAIDCDVIWDNETKSIYLTSDQPPVIQYDAPYDVYANSDWTVAQAEQYGYTMDLDTYATQNYAYLTEYHGTQTDVLVPAKIGGKTTYVAGKSTSADTQVIHLFALNPDITSITFEEGVVAGSYMNFLRGCNNLLYVYNMPMDGKDGTNCFLSCPKLLYIDRIPAALTSMTNFINGCKNISAFAQIPANVKTTINTFNGCTNLTGDIYCLATEITKAENMFGGTEKPIRLHVSYPSTSYTTLEAVGLPENITLVKQAAKIAYLPDEIYVAADVPIDIYNYAVAPEYVNCTFKWDCAVGTSTKSGITLNGTDTQIGDYPLTLTIVQNNEDLISLSATVKVVSKKAIQPTRLLTLGGTYARNTADWMRRMNRYAQNVQFVGTRLTEKFRHEGRISYTPEKYLTDFEYKTDDRGLSTANPFYNPETQKFDIDYYKAYTNISFNSILLFFSTPASAQDTAVTNIKTMVDAICASEPDMPIFIALPPYTKAGNATSDKNNFQFILKMDDAFAGYENVYIVPIALSYNRDTYYNPKNVGLPSTDGYNQFGDCLISALAAAQSKY